MSPAGGSWLSAVVGLTFFHRMPVSSACAASVQLFDTMLILPSL